MQMSLSKAQLEGHLQVLSEKVFQVEKKWPQFKLLLDDLSRISENLKPGSTVVAMERTLLYGGNSLIAPFFLEHNFISLDCSPPSADDRGAYNASMVEDARFIKVPYTKRVTLDLTGLESESVDLILIPNLIHHAKNQHALFKEISRILKVEGQLYIFEPLVRELHQIPDDYLRYTPYGLQDVLANHGFNVSNVATTGGPFSVIAYCWIQALEYLPVDVRDETSKWFYANQYNLLMDYDKAYKDNLVRNHTSFPTAFSVMAVKN